MDGYNNECDDFLAGVEKRVAEEERIAYEVANANVVRDDDGTESADENVPIVTTNNMVGKQKQSRFSWKHALVKQKSFGIENVTKTINPFLNDENYQDLFFSEAVLAVAPYKAAYGQMQHSYAMLVKDLVKKTT